MCALLSSESANEKAVYFLKELKNRTAQKHVLLESNSLLRVLLSTGVNDLHYYSYLNLMLGIHKNFEQNVQPRIQEQLSTFKINKASVWIEEDLEYLPVITDPPRFNAFDSFQTTTSLPLALGRMYVLEGSKLGGKLIGKHLSRQLGIAPGQGASYLAGDGNETFSNWKIFLHHLSSYAVSGDYQQEIIAGANIAFDSIHKHFESHRSHAF